MHCVGGRLAVLLIVLGPEVVLYPPPSIAQEARPTLTIAGRALRCGNSLNILDPRLPNLGMAAPGLVILNPHLLDRQPATVRLFVYHHECGHHHVGADEVAADCWAVRQGARQGWLGSTGIEQVCRSFGNRPATSTHPSGVDRCASLRRCYAGIVGTKAAAARVRAKAARTREIASTPKAGRSGLGRPPD